MAKTYTLRLTEEQVSVLDDLTHDAMLWIDREDECRWWKETANTVRAKVIKLYQRTQEQG